MNSEAGAPQGREPNEYHPPREEELKAGANRVFMGVVDAYAQGYKDGHLSGAYARMLQERAAREEIYKRLSSMSADLNIALRELDGPTPLDG